MDTATKEHVHELLDRIAPAQVAEIIALMEKMLDPVARAQAKAPLDDEPISHAEERAIASALSENSPPSPDSHDDFIAEFGLTLDDWDRLGKTPLEHLVNSR